MQHIGAVCALSVCCECLGHTFWDGGVGDHTVAACHGSVHEFWVALSQFSDFSAHITALEWGNHFSLTPLGSAWGCRTRGCS